MTSRIITEVGHTSVGSEFPPIRGLTGGSKLQAVFYAGLHLLGRASDLRFIIIGRAGSRPDWAPFRSHHHHHGNLWGALTGAQRRRTEITINEPQWPKASCLHLCAPSSITWYRSKGGDALKLERRPWVWRCTGHESQTLRYTHVRAQSQGERHKQPAYTLAVVWRSGSALVSINEVNLRPAG